MKDLRKQNYTFNTTPTFDLSKCEAYRFGKEEIRQAIWRAKSDWPQLWEKLAKEEK